MADNYTPMPVKTKNNGDVVIKLVDSGGTNVAAVSASGALKVEFGAAQAISGTVTANQGTAAAGSGAWPIAVTNTSDTIVKPGDAVNNALRVNIVAGSSSGTEYAEDAALGAAGTGTLMIARRDDALAALTPVEDDAVGLRTNSRGALWVVHDGTMTVSGTVTANAGTGVFDVTPASPAANDYLPVRITDGTNFLGTTANPLVTSTGAAGTLVDSYQTSSALASGGSVTLDSADVGGVGVTGKLVEVTASSSVRTKVRVGTWDGATFTPKRTFFVEANQYLIYQPKEIDEITVTGSAGANDKFRVEFTNMDNTSAADVYCSITHRNV